MIKIEQSLMLSMFKDTANLIYEKFKEKSFEYGTKDNIFKDFQLSEDLGILNVESLIFVRGVLDKLGRVSNLIYKKDGIGNIVDEPLTQTYLEISSSVILSYSYMEGKRMDDFSSETISKVFGDFLKEAKDILEKKNGDYSGDQSNVDSMKNFGYIEKLGLGTIEQGILGRITIKINRLSNFLKKGKDLDRIKLEMIDLVVYLIILYNYTLKKKENQKK